MDNRLDGNAAAAVLEQIFPFEMTTLEATCAGCRQVNVVGALAVYQHGMGTIVRCPSCEWVLIRVSEINGCYWLDMHGVRVLRIPVESNGLLNVTGPRAGAGRRPTVMTHDEVHRLLLRRIRAWQDEDLDAIMADYADDIVHVSPYGTRVGVAAMRAANARYLDEYTGFEVALNRLVVEGDQNALEWTWTDTRRADGRRRSTDDAIVFVLRDGKIAYWREYFDAEARVA